MKKQIIIINGTGGSGKDTFVEFCKKYCRVMNVSSIDKIKELARSIGWSDNQKTEKDRKFLSDLKSLVAKYNDMPFISIEKSVKEFENSNDEVLFIHIREPEEIKRAVDTFHAKTLLIKREGLSNITSNHADAFVDNYDYDYCILNTTLEDLDKQAEIFITKLRGC